MGSKMQEAIALLRQQEEARSAPRTLQPAPSRTSPPTASATPVAPAAVVAAPLAGLQTIRDLQEARRQLAEARAQQAAVEPTARLARQRAEAAETEAQELRRELGETKRRLAEVEALQPIDLRKRLEELTAQVTNLQQQLERTEQQARETRSQAREATSLREEAERTIERLKLTASQGEHDVEELRRLRLENEEGLVALHRAAANLNERDGLIDTAANQIAEQQTEIEQLRLRLETTSQSQIKAERKLAQITSEAEKLQKELLTTQENLRDESSQRIKAERDIKQLQTRFTEQTADFSIILDLLNGRSDRIEPRRLQVIGDTEERPLIALKVATLDHLERGLGEALLDAGVPGRSIERLIECLRVLDLAD